MEGQQQYETCAACAGRSVAERKMIEKGEKKIGRPDLRAEDGGPSESTARLGEARAWCVDGLGGRVARAGRGGAVGDGNTCGAPGCTEDCASSARERAFCSMDTFFMKLEERPQC